MCIIIIIIIMRIYEARLAKLIVITPGINFYKPDNVFFVVVVVVYMYL